MNASPSIAAAPWPPPSSAISYEDYVRLLESRPELSADGDTLSRRIAVERILVLAFGRAILMQYAHPAIAAAVAQHSYSMDSAASKVARFNRTMALRMQLTFGDSQAVWRAAQQIDDLHASVWGEMDSSTGDGGARYSARDPELIKWVHATVVDSTLVVYQHFVRPLSLAERNEYLLRASTTGPLLGAQQTFLETDAQLHQYMSEVVASGVLRATPDGVRMSREILKGLPVPIVGGVANAMGRVLVKELLPPWCAAVYDMPSTAPGRLFLNGSAMLLKMMRPIIPSRLLLWPATAPNVPHPNNAGAQQRGGGCPFHR